MANVKLGLSAYIRLGCVIVVYFCCVVRGKISRRICLSIVKYLTISPSERKPALAFLFVFGSQRFWAFVGKALSSGLTSHPNLPTDNLNDAASYLQNRVCPRFVCSHVFCVLVFMRFNLDIYGLISGISLSARFCVLCFFILLVCWHTFLCRQVPLVLFLCRRLHQYIAVLGGLDGLLCRSSLGNAFHKCLCDKSHLTKFWPWITN